MIPNIIHNPDRYKRYAVLMKELETQGISEYKLCPAVIDWPVFRGISKAFKNIVQQAKDQEQESVIIFEDDIKFTAPGAYDHWIKNTPEEYDIYFGGIFLGEILPDNILKSFTALHCIRVHNRFYDKFLSADPDKHLDVALNETGGVFKVAYPMVAVQHDGFSDNAQKECSFGSLLERWELWK